MRLAHLVTLLTTTLVFAGGQPNAKPANEDAEDPRYDQAFDLQEKGKLEEALALYEKVVRADQEHGDAWYEIGVIQRELGRPDEAQYALVRAVKYEPKMAEAWSELGAAQLDRKSLDDAYKSFQEALKLDPSDALAIHGVGAIALSKGALAEAEKDLKVAIRLDAEMTEAYVELGSVYLKQGKNAEALSTLRAGFETAPTHGDAAKAYADAVAQVGSDRDKSYLAAWSAVERESYAEAETALKALVSADPKDLRSFALLGCVYLEGPTPDPKGAVSAFRTALSLDSKAAATDRLPKAAKDELLEGLGRAYIDAKDLDKAEQTLKSGQQHDPEFAYFPYYLATVAASRPKPSVNMAMAELKLALSLDRDLIAEVRDEEAFDSIRENPAFQQLLTEFGSSN